MTEKDIIIQDLRRENAELRAKLAKDTNVHTNADRIRSMSDEEMADFLKEINACSNCAKRWNSCFPHWDVLEWLQQPPKEGE